MKITTEKNRLSFWYYLILFTLAITSLIMVLLPYVFSLSPFWQKRLNIIGAIIYTIFFVDFIYFWYKAQWERKYLRDNWVSLAAILLPLKGLKALKGIKGLKALKGVKGLKAIKLGRKVKSKSQDLNC